MSTQRAEDRVVYYDWLLAAMAAAVLLGAAASVHSAISVATDVKVGGAVAMLVLYQALFRRPPELDVNRHTAAVLGWHFACLGQLVVW